MKKILIGILTAGLILTACACSCGGNTIETKPITSTENSNENEPIISDDNEDIFGDDFDDSEENSDNQNSDNSDKITTNINDDNANNIDPSVQTATVIEQETQRTTMPVTDKTSISTYATYITAGTWINLLSEDTIVFNDDGTFEGKINGTSYSGTFSMRIKEKGVCILGIIFKKTKEEVEFLAKFENSAKITLTTHKGDSESFILQ